MTPPKPDEEKTVVRDGIEYEEVSHDDQVIGRAFRLSLGVLVGLAAVGGGAYWWVNRPEEVAPAQDVTPDAPKAMAREAQPPTVRFTDVTSQSGIDFVHQNGAEGDKLLPETMGGGSAFLDYDADGDQDILFVNSCFWPGSPRAGENPHQALYANDGKGHFTSVGSNAGLDVTFYGMGVACADADGDGDVDLYFTAVGPNHYFAKEGTRFEERDVGAAGAADAWSTCACFFDAERDGDLDLYVGNYVHWSREIDLQVAFSLDGKTRSYGPPKTFEGSQPYYFRNDGSGRFVEAAKEAGLQVLNPATGVPSGKALGVRANDPDLDGYLDLMVANDTVVNFFYKNLGNGTFRECGLPLGLAVDKEGSATGAMGIDSAWFRNDDSIAYAIGNFANESSSFYVSQGRADLWADEAIGAGIGAPTRKHLSFGALFLDYDLDGRQDFLQANGHLESEINHFQPSQTYEQPAQLFWNAGDEVRNPFVVVSPETTGDLQHPIVGRGCASADVDGDGDLDVLLTQVGGKPLLLRNELALGNRGLRLTLVASGANREAIGARVEVFAGGTKQCQDLVPFRSYLSQVELPLTFGLGTGTRADKVVVHWPDGSTQEFPGLEAGAHVLKQGG